MKMTLHKRFRLPVKFMIEGKEFSTVHEVYCLAANAKGFNGSEALIAARLKKGATTWAEIAFPAQPQAATAARAIARKRKQEECAALMADMDARKAAMKDAA